MSVRLILSSDNSVSDGTLVSGVFTVFTGALLLHPDSINIKTSRATRYLLTFFMLSPVEKILVMFDDSFITYYHITSVAASVRKKSLIPDNKRLATDNCK